MIRESYIEQKVCEYAKKLGWLALKFTSPGNNGMPDRMFLKAGVTVFVEFKAPGKVSTPIQERQQERLRRFGFQVVVIDSIESGKAFVNSL